MMRKVLCALAASVLLVPALVLLSGCKEKGPMEKAGERADDIVDNVKKGEAPLHKKGTAEKMGEAVDDTVDDLKKKTDSSH